MKKEYIEMMFRSFLAQDGANDLSDKDIYLCRPLVKKTTDGSQQTEYGFSLTIFGVMALRTQYKGKWADYIEITSHCQKNLSLPDAVPYQDDYYKIKLIGDQSDEELLQKIYLYCRNNALPEFDCCAEYLKCSDAMKCCHPIRQRGLLCSYRKKLEKGIVYYGKNRNVD